VSKVAHRTRSYSWQESSPVEGASGLTGLELLKLSLPKDGARAAIMATLDFAPAEFDHGWAVFEGQPSDIHYNNIGSVHGGYFATLLDSAMSCAVQSALPSGVGYSTVDLRVSLLRRLTEASGRVRCEGKLVNLGRRIAHAEGRLIDGSGELCAVGTVTCVVIQPASAAR
jgi:uncharacterized protein (TIGR00369 family)